MTTLIALLSTGKGTWTEVMRLMGQAEWEKIILVTNQFGKEKFNHERPYTLIVVDFSQPLGTLVKELGERIAETVPGGLATEVALNFSSGIGKEHMAVLSAVLKSGLAIRLVVPGDQEPIEI